MNQNKNEYETCIICFKQTKTKKNTPIYKRVSYVEGCGQLCDACFKKLYPSIHRIHDYSHL